MSEPDALAAAQARLAAAPAAVNADGLVCRCAGDWFCRAWRLGERIDALQAVVDAQAARLRAWDQIAGDAPYLTDALVRIQELEARLAAVEGRSGQDG